MIILAFIKQIQRLPPTKPAAAQSKIKTQTRMGKVVPTVTATAVTCQPPALPNPKLL